MEAQPEPIVKKRPKYTEIDRSQLLWTDLYVENLIGADHPARMIWEIIGRLDLSAFEQDAASFEREAGRPGWPPRLLLSVLTYSYTLGVSSAREMERRMGYEPGLRWLTVSSPVNHHTLSDFRTQDLDRLKTLMTQVLAVLSEEGLVDFQTILQDGTKMKAQASKQSFRRRKTLSEHRAEAQRCVEELNRRANEEAAGRGEPAGKPTKQEAAQRRAARERLERMDAALRELAQREAAAKAAEKEKLRVSESEAEARKMKHADGSFAPSYNLQLVTEIKHGFIVGWTVSQAPNDHHELEPALEVAQRCTQQTAATVIADMGYANRTNIEKMAARNIVLVAPRVSEEQRQAGAMAVAGLDTAYAAAKFTVSADEQTLRCPAGAALVQVKDKKHHGLPVRIYEAEAAVCGACPHQAQCSPQRAARRVERVIESAAVQRQDRRMAEPAMQALYKKRKQVAEYPNMRIKSDWRLDQFRLRGLKKVTQEAFWMVLAFTMDRWHSLRQRKNGVAVGLAAA